MAKKSKKKKAGILKRKQQKKHKKALNRRQNPSHQPKKVDSAGSLKQLLQGIPLLAYEPELAEFGFEKEAMQPLEGTEESEPYILKRLVTLEFLEDCIECLEQMQSRIPEDHRQHKLLNALIEELDRQGAIPRFVNPLVLAIYLRSKAQHEGTPLESSQIHQALEAFHTEHETTFKELVEIYQEENREALMEPMFDDDDEPPLYELLDEYYETLEGMEKEQAERRMEDIETFIEEYTTQPVEEWNVELMDAFLGDWFVKYLHPTVEDMVSMQHSLEHFFQFLQDQEHMSHEESQKILDLLKDKETYKQKMLSSSEAEDAD